MGKGALAAGLGFGAGYLAGGGKFGFGEDKPAATPAPVVDRSFKSGVWIEAGSRKPEHKLRSIWIARRTSLRSRPRRSFKRRRRKR
jgi:hypothetical protein